VTNYQANASDTLRTAQGKGVPACRPGSLEPYCCSPGCPDCSPVSPIGRTHQEAAEARKRKREATADAVAEVVELRRLDDKLETFDLFSDAACDELVRLLTEEREYLKRLAAGRHATGHFLYGDSLMYEYDQTRLLTETAEELADGINYTVVKLSRS
jgi:hypothetical protein